MVINDLWNVLCNLSLWGKLEQAELSGSLFKVSLGATPLPAPKDTNFSLQNETTMLQYMSQDKDTTAQQANTREQIAAATRKTNTKKKKKKQEEEEEEETRPRTTRATKIQTN